VKILACLQYAFFAAVVLASKPLAADTAADSLFNNFKKKGEKQPPAKVLGPAGPEEKPKVRKVPAPKVEHPKNASQSSPDAPPKIEKENESAKPKTDLQVETAPKVEAVPEPEKPKKGWEFEVAYKGQGDQIKNTEGERKKMYLHNLDLRLKWDLEKSLGLKGTTFNIAALGDWGASDGNSPSAFVEDAQGTNNIETGVDDFKLYEAWVQQQFADNKASVLIGIRDLNADFYVTDSAGSFLNSSFGVGREFSQTGDMGPSIFPYTTAALRLKVEPTPEFYFMGGVFGANAGYPDDPWASNFSFHGSDGFLLINEMGLQGTEASAHKYALGYWTYTRTFDKFDAEESEEQPDQVVSSGTYVLLDQAFSSFASGFVRYGLAFPGAYEIKNNLSAGVDLHSFWSLRSKDSLGLGITRVSSVDSSLPIETAYEIFYKFDIGFGMSIQPDIQYVKNPGFSDASEGALIESIRIEIAL